ncbi:MAG: hypothetical protein U9O20_02420 [Patescibacteria group bacterium]|nr:hypothetical protein [Patescibacteria group bacterium]
MGYFKNLTDAWQTTEEESAKLKELLFEIRLVESRADRDSVTMKEIKRAGKARSRVEEINKGISERRKKVLFPFLNL